MLRHILAVSQVKKESTFSSFSDDLTTFGTSTLNPITYIGLFLCLLTSLVAQEEHFWNSSPPLMFVFAANTPSEVPRVHVRAFPEQRSARAAS